MQAICDVIERAAAGRRWVSWRRWSPLDGAAYGQVSDAISAKLRDCVVRDAIVIEKKAKPGAVRNRYIALHID